jgi:hypothetical protein
MATSQGGWPIIVRLPAAALLVLVLPGFALTRAALAGAPLGWQGRTATTLGLSLSVSALGGVVFQLLDLRADLLTWTVWLLGVTVVAIVLAVARDLRRPAAAPAPKVGRPSITPAHAGLFTLAAVVTLAAMVLAWGAATAQVQPTAVQLWMLPVAGAQPAAITVGIHNEALTPAHYRLVLNQTATVSQTWTIDLQGGQVWETTSVLDPASVGHAIVAALFDDADGAASIRTVSYWNAGGAGG